MKKVLVFQHVAHEILGTFHPLLKQAAFRIRYANFGRHPGLSLDIERYDGLVILGGPMGVYESEKHPHLHAEIQAVREAIERGLPVLGICLGAQLIAAALGADVTPSPAKEIGWYDVALTDEGKADPVLGELRPTERIFQWHGDTFKLPPGAQWLARSAACDNQAFRFGTKVYGFQFHLEVDEPMIERWLGLPAHRNELEAGGFSPEQIRAETRSHIARLNELSRRVFSRYIGLFSTKRRTIVLGHRR